MKSFTSIAYKVLTALMIVMLVLTALPVSPVQAADTGWQSPTSNAATTGGDGNGFELNPTNAYADNPTNQSYASNINGESDRHIYYGYNLGAVPVGASISGIEVRLDWWVDSTFFTSSSMSAELSWNGGTTWTAAQTDNGDTTDTAHSVILGGTANNWGHTWTDSELSAANFRVRLTSTGSGTRDFYLDWVPVRVSYTLPSTTALTSSLNPSNAGDSVIFTATVTGAGATPTGTVTFRDGATVLGAPVALNAGGVAAYTTSALTGGSHNITATYSGDTTYATSNAALTQGVNQVPAFTSAAATTFTVGTAGTFNVVVTGSPTPTIVRTGDALPAGVNFNTTTGLLNGTPAAGTVGTYNLVFTATNAGGTATQNFTLTVGKGNQTITFAQPPTPAGFNTTYTITPTASSGLPVTVVATGSCTIAGNVVTYSSMGTCTLTASQGGDASYNAAPNVVRTVQVQPATTTTTILSSVNPSVLGQPVIFTVRVLSGVVPVTSGTVTLSSCEWLLIFCNGATTVWGTQPVVAGVATFTISNLPVGRNGAYIIPNRMTAVYNGGGNYAGSNTTLDQTVNTANTAVTLTSSINPSSFNQPVLFTATVSVQAPGAGQVSGGAITLYEGATALCNGTANALGVMTCTISNLAMGTHLITAHFVGTDDFGTSTSPILTQIVRRPSTTTLVSAPNPSVYGQSVTFTATVTGAAAMPTGNVSFYDGVTLLGTSALNAGGVATLNYNALIVGDHNITAVYSGNLFYVSSTSPIVIQSVTPATLTVTADPQTITYGDADPLFTFQYGGFLLGDNAADINVPPTCDAPAPHVNVGTYASIIVCSGAADDNYNFAYVNGTLTVTQKALTITADNQGKTYGFTLTFNGTEFTTLGLIFGDTVTSVTLNSAGAIASATNGSYPIIPTNAVGSGLGNYAITYVNGTLTVGGNLLVITPNDRVKTYGQAITFTGLPTEFTYALPGGGALLPGESITSVTLASFGTAANAPVGTYPIVPSNVVGVGLGNYVIIYNNGQLDVNQALLTFNPDSHTKTYGDTFTALLLPMRGILLKRTTW